MQSMLATNQSHTLMLQPTTASTAVSTAATGGASGSVPVIVEVQRLGDNVRFKYNINVQPPGLSSSASVEQQHMSILALEAMPEGASCSNGSSGTELVASTGSNNNPAAIESNMLVTQQSMTHVVQTNFFSGASTFFETHPTQTSFVTAALPPTPTTNSSASMALAPYSAPPPLNVSYQGNVLPAPATHINTDTWTQIVCPPALQNLFRWNYCELCKAAMRTVRNAVDHYSSRAHYRRVCTWMLRNFNEYGALPKEVLQYAYATGPDAFYCELCDLKLTSLIHANQHFFGRRHRMVARRISKPNGPGYYDARGKWVRTNSKWLVCPLCGVSITSQSQMAMHLAGSKHQKKLDIHFNLDNLRINGSFLYTFTPEGVLYPLNPQGKYIHRVMYNDNFRKFVDMNALYYCELCEVSLNHLKSVKQHEDGKLHRKKSEKLKFFFRFCS